MVIRQLRGCDKAAPFSGIVVDEAGTITHGLHQFRALRCGETAMAERVLCEECAKREGLLW